MSRYPECEAEPGILNETIISLIPKVKEPRLVKDFRPISLCNVAYKVLFRCLTERLKGTMGAAISEA